MAATLFSVRPHAKTGDPRPTVWEKHFQNRLSWRFRKKKRESRQNPRLTVGLGKFNAKTVYHGDSSRKSGAHAKARERLGKNRSGTRLSWRSRFFPMALTPKPATEFWENRMGSRLSWRFRKKTRRLRQKRQLDRFGEIRSGNRLSWRSRNQAIRSAKPFGLAKQYRMALVVGAIDHNGPQILLSPFPIADVFHSLITLGS